MSLLAERPPADLDPADLDPADETHETNETDAAPTPSGEVGAVHWVGTADADRCPPAGVEVLRRLAASGLID